MSSEESISHLCRDCILFLTVLLVLDIIFPPQTICKIEWWYVPSLKGKLRQLEKSHYISSMFTALKEKEKFVVPHFLCLVYCRWLSVRLEFLGNLMVFFAALFVVLAGNTVSSSAVGLSISYALNVSHGIFFLLFSESHVRD